MLITTIGKQKLEEKIKQFNQELDRTSQDREDAAREGDLKENSAYIFLGDQVDVNGQLVTILNISIGNIN